MSHLKNPYYAAIDLGSNSFHLIIVQLTENGIQEIDKIKHMVRLGEGLQEDGKLSIESINYALEALTEMHQRIVHIPSDQIRAVGTNTMRIAKNGAEFLHEAERCLGVEIEIISGQEEARLIYLGISTHNHFKGHNLVIDVGGGSTELIIGENQQPILLRSMNMGCANMSRHFFPQGIITQKSITRALNYVAKTVEPHRQEILSTPHQQIILSSGTAKNVERVLAKLGLSKNGVTQENIHQLLDHLAQIGNIKKFPRKLDISTERAFGFIGGVCILVGLFEELGIEQAVVSQQALREGVLLDLMEANDTPDDQRLHTVLSMQKRFNIDIQQAQKVEILATYINQHLPLKAPLRFQLLLKYAADLHEIGLSVALSKHQNHGAYLIGNADMPGFSQSMQNVMAALIKGQRKKMSGKYIEELPEAIQAVTWQYLLSLRLAVLLYRSRNPINQTQFPVITYQNDTLALGFTKAFLRDHPLTVSDLTDESKYWEVGSKFHLKVEITN